MFELHSHGQGKEQSNIWILEQDNCDTRVVVIPINKEMIDFSNIEEEMNQEE